MSFWSTVGPLLWWVTHPQYLGDKSRYSHYRHHPTDVVPPRPPPPPPSSRTPLSLPPPPRWHGVQGFRRFTWRGWDHVGPSWVGVQVSGVRDLWPVVTIPLPSPSSTPTPEQSTRVLPFTLVTDGVPGSVATSVASVGHSEDTESPPRRVLVGPGTGSPGGV